MYEVHGTQNNAMLLIVFSLPFIVGHHSHTPPRCNCNDKEFSISSSKSIIASRSSKLIKKVKDALSFGASTVMDGESSEESESSSSSASAERVKRKSKSKRRSSKTKTKSKKKVESKIKRNQRPVSVPASESSSEIGII